MKKSAVQHINWFRSESDKALSLYNRPEKEGS